MRQAPARGDIEAARLEPNSFALMHCLRMSLANMGPNLIQLAHCRIANVDALIVGRVFYVPETERVFHRQQQ